MARDDALVKAATIESLDAYCEAIKELAHDFGRDVWWLTYQGVSWMRNEKFETIHRGLETTQAQWSTVDARVCSAVGPV